MYRKVEGKPNIFQQGRQEIKSVDKRNEYISAG